MCSSQRTCPQPVAVRYLHAYTDSNVDIYRGFELVNWCVRPSRNTTPPQNRLNSIKIQFVIHRTNAVFYNENNIAKPIGIARRWHEETQGDGDKWPNVFYAMRKAWIKCKLSPKLTLCECVCVRMCVVVSRDDEKMAKTLIINENWLPRNSPVYILFRSGLQRLCRRHVLFRSDFFLSHCVTSSYRSKGFSHTIAICQLGHFNHYNNLRNGRKRKKN